MESARNCNFGSNRCAAENVLIAKKEGLSSPTSIAVEPVVHSLHLLAIERGPNAKLEYLKTVIRGHSVSIHLLRDLKSFWQIKLLIAIMFLNLGSAFGIPKLFCLAMKQVALRSCR